MLFLMKYPENFDVASLYQNFLSFKAQAKSGELNNNIFIIMSIFDQFTLKVG